MDPMLGWQSEQHNTVKVASSRFRDSPEIVPYHHFASGVVFGLFKGARGNTQLRGLRSSSLDGAIFNGLLDVDD